jgi:hypothetical protein
MTLVFCRSQARLDAVEAEFVTGQRDGKVTGSLRGLSVIQFAAAKPG